MELHVCSDLVAAVQWQEADGRIEGIEVSLEAVSASRVCLRTDRPILEHTRLRLLCPSGESQREFLGEVTRCRFHAGAGYSIETQLRLFNEWPRTQDLLRRVAEIGGLPDRAKGENGAPGNRCCAGTCSWEVRSRAVEWEVPLAERARAAGREAANFCGGMDEAMLEACFSSLFLGIPPTCRLFREFSVAYRVQQAETETIVGD